MIQTELLLDYMCRFVGFGSPRARIWFVGLEQGGGESLSELQRRLSAWAELGATPFADLREYCERMGERRWHGDPPRIQPTLGKLVRIVLASEGLPRTPDTVRHYQANQFGRADGDTVIAELMPLPSRNVSEWIYSTLDLPALAARDTYVRAYRALRVELLQVAIRAAEPKAVVFLGLSETATWAEIAARSFTDGPAGAKWASSGSTRFVVLKHPTAFGAQNSYVDKVGQELAA